MGRVVGRLRGGKAFIWYRLRVWGAWPGIDRKEGAAEAGMRVSKQAKFSLINRFA